MHSNRRRPPDRERGPVPPREALTRGSCLRSRRLLRRLPPTPRRCPRRPARRARVRCPRGPAPRRLDVLLRAARHQEHSRESRPPNHHAVKARRYLRHRPSIARQLSSRSEPASPPSPPSSRTLARFHRRPLSPTLSPAVALAVARAPQGEVTIAYAPRLCSEAEVFSRSEANAERARWERAGVPAE